MLARIDVCSEGDCFTEDSRLTEYFAEKRNTLGKTCMVDKSINKFARPILSL